MVIFHSYVKLPEGNVRPDKNRCDITETILLNDWEVANPCARPRGKIRPRWHVKDTLNTFILMRKQYHLIIMRDQNPPPPQNNMLVGEITSTLSL